MSKVNKLSVKEIFDITNGLFTINDIAHFCLSENTIKEYAELYKKTNGDQGEIKEFLIENENEIDKEKLILMIYYNYQQNLKAIERNLLEDIGNKRENYNRFSKLLGEREKEELFSEKTKRLLRDVDAYIGIPNFDPKSNKILFDIISSKEIYTGKRKNGKKFLQKMQVMESELSDDKENEEKNNYIIYLFQTLLLSDLAVILPDKELGLELREVILNNAVMESKNIVQEHIDEIRSKSFKEYEDLLDSVEPRCYLPELREELIKQSRVIDMDKILLICAYRYEEYTEGEMCTREQLEAVQQYVAFIQKHIENKNTSFKGIIERKSDFSGIEIEYEYNDINKFLSRFIDGVYFSKKQLNDIKKNIMTGKTYISDVDLEIINILDLSNEEIEEIMKKSTNNFIYFIELLKLPEKDIMEEILKMENIPEDLIEYLMQEKRLSIESELDLYYLGKINPEFFKEFIEETKISSKINLQTINNLYINSKKEKDNEDIKNKLNKQIELYKVLNLDEKEKEELEEASEGLIYELAENFDKDNQDLMFYYNNGLITLSTVAQWAGDSEIEKLYQESTIQMQDIEDLYNNGFIKQKTIEKIILDSKPEYAELLAYIFLGYISEETIEKMYMEGRIFDETLSDMFKEGIVSPNKYLELIEKRSKEVLEKHAKIKLEPILYNIPDEKMKINIVDENEMDSTYHYRKNKKTKEVIHPEARRELLRRLGAMQAKAEIEDSGSAFYNYEFFVIPNERGELESNSVVIAERFYKDKELENELATENATYFFQYKDLMVNSNLSKKEMMEDKKNIVFTSSHRIGGWAVSVLYRLAQTRASSDFKDYRKGDERATRVIDELRKMYTDKQIESILEQVKEIDDDQLYTYEEVNSTFSKTSTDDEQR